MERLLDYFVPERYKLDIAIDKKKKTIGGMVTVWGEAKDEVVKFHAVRLDVTNVMVNGVAAKFKADGEILTISKVPMGEAEIEIEYNGKLNENMQGAYLSTYEYEGRTETIVTTQFESHYAREAFPCIDEPAAKAVFELTLAVDDPKDVVLANTLECGESEGGVCSGAFRSAAARGLAPSARGDGPDGRGPGANSGSDLVTFHAFEPTPRMSTYLLAFVVGRFHGKTVVNEHGVEITTYCALNQDVNSVDFANEVAAKSLVFYDDNFGVKYPLKKLTQVALPDFEAGAMENWGLVTYRESMLLAGKNATLGARKGVALTVAHELSHQWFGNLVTMKWWDDLWLNESFATAMEYMAVDTICPDYNIWEDFFTGDAYLALMRDAYSDVQSVHQKVDDPAEIATLFDPAIVYAKGAHLMLMVIRLMGWEKFCEGIKDYFHKHAYGNTVGNDLWAALGHHAEFDVGEMMHSFIDRPGYPVIESTAGDFAKFTQKRFLVDDKITEEEWPLPEVTEDMSGHYVLNLNDAEFQRRLEDFDKLSLEEKIRLLIDRNLISKTELAPSASLLALVERFCAEKSAAVWGVVLSIISGLKIFFEVDSPEEGEYKKFVQKLVEKKLGEIGLVTREGDDENTLRLRKILLGMDFYAEDEARIRELAGMYSRDYAKLDSEIREDILDAKLYLEPAVIEDYLKAYSETADPEVKFELLFSGAVSKDEAVLARMLGLLGRTDVVKPQDQLYLYVYLYRNPRSRERAFSWLREHWTEVREMMGDKSLDSYPRYMANVARTEAELAEYLDFFGPMREDPALARAVEIGEKEIRARVKLIEEDKARVIQTLGARK